MNIPEDFHDDGCTWWPDKIFGVNIRPFCREHDYGYYLGGTKKERLEVDRKFRNKLATLGKTWWQRLAMKANAKIMYAGVRVGGARHWKIRNAYWGYGWPIEEYGLGYAEGPAVP